MSTLALLGGKPEIDRELPPYRTIGEEERLAVDRVMQTGELSGYVGEWCEAFDGGTEVRAFEAAWAEQFQVGHAIAVNSNTSGLIAAVGAAGVSPGDEVIVPPYTMSATAMAPLIYGGIPVFVDIEPDTYCLDPNLVREAITSRIRCASRPNNCTKAFHSALLVSISCGLTQTESTGVLTAKTTPFRSMILPRCAGTLTVRK